MADDITLKMNVDTSDAVWAIDKFNESAEKAFKSSNTSTQAWGQSLNKVTTQMTKIVSQMSDLEAGKLPADVATKLQSELKKTNAEITKTEKYLDKLQKHPIETAEYAQWKTILDNANSSIKDIETSLKRDFGKSAWTDVFAGTRREVETLTKKVQDAQAKVNAFESAGTYSGDRYDNAVDKLNKLTLKLQDATEREQELIEKGQQFKDQDAYNQATQDLSLFKNQAEQAEQAMYKLDASGNKFDTTEIDNTNIKLNDLYNNANKIKTALNTPYTGDYTQSNEYQQLASRLTDCYNKGTILDNKINDINGDLRKTSGSSSTFKNSFTNAANSIISKLRSIKGETGKTQTSHNKSFKSMLTTVLKYGFGIRSIFLLYKKVRSTISTGLSEMSKQFSDVADDVYTLKNSWSGFKASLVSAFQPILSYVVPVLTTLINYLTSAMNAIANFFALLTGQSYYYKAVKGNESVADSIGSTGSAADDANEELAEYDDLIVIDQDSSSGGGGGGGSSSSDAWQWEKVAVEANSWIDKIKEAFNTWDFTEIGTELSNKLTGILKSIPWETVYSYASNFGKGLATFLNGLITDDLFSALGTTIANALNTALMFLNTFGTTFNWTNFGNSIASGINAFVKDFNLNLAVDTFNAWANGILNTLITAVQGVKWTDLAQKIADGIAGIDASGIGWKLGTLVTSLINAIYDLVSNKDTWKNLGTKIGDGVNGFFKGFNGKDLIDAINAIKDALFEAITTAIETIDWDEIAKDISDFINGIDLGEVTIAIGAIALASTTKTFLATQIPKLLKSEVSGITGFNGQAASLGTVAVSVIASLTIGWEIGTNLYEAITGEEVEQTMLEEMFDVLDWLGGDEGNMQSRIKGYALQAINPFSIPFKFAWEALNIDELFDEIKTSINDAIDEADTWLEENGNFIIEGLIEGAKNALLTLTFPGSAILKWVVDSIKTAFGINSPATSMYEYGEYILEGLLQGIKNKFDSIKTTISTIYTKFVSAIKEKFSNFSISNVVTGLGNVAINIVTTLSGGITKLADFTGLNTTLNNIKTKYTTMKAKLTTTLSGAFNKITGDGSTLSTLATKWSELKNSWTDKLATLKANVGGQMSQVSDITNWQTYFTNLKTAWADKTSTLKAYVGGQATNIDDITGDKGTSWKTKFSNFVNNIWNDDTATMKAEATVGGTSDGRLANFTSGGTWYSRFTSFRDLWNKTYTTTMSANATIGGSTDNTLSNFSDNTGSKWRKKFTDFIGLWNRTTTATFNATYSEADTNSAGYKAFTDLKNNWKGASTDFNCSYTEASTQSQGYKDFCELWNSWYGRTADFTLSFSSSTANVKDLVNGALGKVYDSLSLAGITMKQKVWFAKGGIVTGLTNLTDVMVGEAGAEAIIPLERNLGWMDKMATAISDKVANIGLPDIVTGKILPSTTEFNTMLETSTKNIEAILQAILDRLDRLESNDSNHPSIMLQLDSRTVAEVVWDETEKRYKQTGIRYAY